MAGEPGRDAVEQACDLLSRWNRRLPAAADVALVAQAISARDRSVGPDAVADAELLAAHDRLAQSPARHGAWDVLGSLAEALLGRGIVPAPDDHGGEWWLWWPKRGHGRCQHCGNDRSLTRYSARFGKPYRYLCQRCRKNEPAARDRGVPLDSLLTELDADEYFATYFKAVVGFAGSKVLPDLVPDAAALGVAAWCWRNDTAVEAWHLPGNVLMARVNIAVTRAVLPHVDPYEGVDWDSVETALTDPDWALPDGRAVAGLFGDGWPEVERSVRERVRAWKRVDEDLIGPEATLRLLTVGGSTSYTRHWWGQGRWAAICRAIVSDAVDGGVALPGTYGERGPDDFIRDLADPDELGDEALNWMIDMPGAGESGAVGLRFHPATRPVVREFFLYLDEDD